MTPPAAYGFAVVCEASADLTLSTGLADRVLCHDVEWIEPESLDLHRRWRGLNEGDSHLEWHWVKGLAKQHHLRAHGHFLSEPGVLAAALARKALLLLKGAQRVPDAVVLVHDTEGRWERRLGFEQARKAFPWPFEIVLAVAHAKRECWILAGFDPRSRAETKALSELRKGLGFDPRLQAENLTAAEPQALRNAKRVLDRLLGGSQDREEDCWRSCDLAILTERGAMTGLADFLDEVRSRLVPLFLGARPES